MRPFRRLPVLVVLFALLAAAAPARADDPAFLSFAAGAFDIGKDDTAAEFRVEYRHDRRFWIFKPLAGLMATSDGGVYGYAGVGIDMFFGRRWVVTPSFAPGAYEEGSGKDLGHTIEFRSQLEVAYRFDNRARLGLSISHMSNASIGDKNPGEESLMLNYSLPFGALFGRE